jgi:hypothetical protein
MTSDLPGVTIGVGALVWKNLGKLGQFGGKRAG